MLLELADSQITYRQRYLMVAARAPVIDLVMLDPNNPRSVAFQLDRIETHLAALPGRNAAGRLSPVQQIAAAVATRLRTVDAAAIDEALIIDIEQSLMKLSDAITAVLSHHQRTLRIGVGGAGVIYDVRQTTTCSYATPVAQAHHVLRLMPIPRPGQRVHVAALQIVPEPRHRREGQDFFGNRLTWIEIEEPHKNTHGQTGGARRRRRGGRAGRAGDAAPGKRSATRRLPRATSGRCRPRISCFQAAWCRSIRRFATIRGRVLPPAGRVLDAAIELMNRLKSDITYEIGATTVTTTPPMSFALRRGVCQDFAHIMISGLRGIGLPAVYVSGYLRSDAAHRSDAIAGRRRHACLGAGMVRIGSRLDRARPDQCDASPPTSTSCSAIGRDYTDVAPMDGVIVGSGGQRIDVAVSVLPAAN